jgi:hypothetical protein
MKEFETYANHNGVPNDLRQFVEYLLWNDQGQSLLTALWETMWDIRSGCFDEGGCFEKGAQC